MGNRAAHKKVEAGLAHRLLDSFSQIAEVINTEHLDYGSRMDRMLKIILAYLEAEQGSIMVVDKRKRLIVQAATRAELIGHQQSLDDDSVASLVAKSKEPLYIQDIFKDKRFKGRAARKSYKKNALMSVPVLHKGQVIGVINVTDKAGNKDLHKEDIGRLFNFSGLILSILVQQNLQEELKKQQKTLKKRNKELQRQQKMRAELSKMLVHDLKGPLSEVVANLDILSYTISDQNREFLESAQMGCNRAVRMVSNLVSISKIEDGKLRLLKEEVEPQSLIDESYSSVKGLATIKQLTLKKECDEQLPPIKIDRVLILRVLQNLLTNALGYSEPDGLIVFGCKKVPGRKRLEFFVQDQGAGIPLDRQKTIFEKYARISEKHDELVGTGLGLYFCRLAVEKHRGAIGVHSSMGQGSRFFFTLPL